MRAWAGTVAAAGLVAACGSVTSRQPAGDARSSVARSVPAVAIEGGTGRPGAEPGSTTIPAVGDATVTSAAVRGTEARPGARCDLTTVDALARRHPDVGQWVLVVTGSWTSTTATVEVVARDDAGRWVCQRGAQPGLVGRSGSRPLLERRSGDGTTPAGVFPLGTTTAWDGQAFQFFGNGPDPGVRGTYRRVRPGDCWGATPGTPSYNHLVRSFDCAGPDDEYLPDYTGSYVHAAVIGANNEPFVSGDAPGEPPYAAAIFLHRHAYDDGVATPTSGCVSLAVEDLVPTLVLLDPARAPHFAIGPLDWLRDQA